MVPDKKERKDALLLLAFFFVRVFNSFPDSPRLRPDPEVTQFTYLIGI